MIRIKRNKKSAKSAISSLVNIVDKVSDYKYDNLIVEYSDIDKEFIIKEYLNIAIEIWKERDNPKKFLIGNKREMFYVSDESNSYTIIEDLDYQANLKKVDEKLETFTSYNQDFIKALLVEDLEFTQEYEANLMKLLIRELERLEIEYEFIVESLPDSFVSQVGYEKTLLIKTNEIK